MAQGSKSRIIIWTIVAILAVVAIVMLVTKPKESGKPPVNPERFARMMESRFQKLERKVSDARSMYPETPTEQWQMIDEEIERGRQVLAGMPGLTDQNVLVPKRDSVQKAYGTAKKALKEITGKEDKEPAGDE